MCLPGHSDFHKKRLEAIQRKKRKDRSCQHPLKSHKSSALPGPPSCHKNNTANCKQDSMSNKIMSPLSISPIKSYYYGKPATHDDCVTSSKVDTPSHARKDLGGFVKSSSLVSPSKFSGIDFKSTTVSDCIQAVKRKPGKHTVAPGRKKRGTLGWPSSSSDSDEDIFRNVRPKQVKKRKASSTVTSASAASVTSPSDRLQDSHHISVFPEADQLPTVTSSRASVPSRGGHNADEVPSSYQPSPPRKRRIARSPGI